MKTDSHGNGNGLNDLYVLPESEEERIFIEAWLEHKKISYEWSYADVKWHEWFGKRFIEIPFGECHREGLELLEANIHNK